MCDLYNKILNLVESLESATLINNENGSFYIKTSNDVFFLFVSAQGHTKLSCYPTDEKVNPDYYKLLLEYNACYTETGISIGIDTDGHICFQTLTLDDDLTNTFLSFTSKVIEWTDLLSGNRVKNTSFINKILRV